MNARAYQTTDFWTGVIFLAIAAFIGLYGAAYMMGSAARMGPGYFPRLLSIGLGLVGTILVVRAILSTERRAMGPLALRPLFVVCVATALFGLLIERTGLLITGVGVVMLTRLATPGYRLLEVAALAVALVLTLILIFRVGFGMRMPILPF